MPIAVTSATTPMPIDKASPTEPSTPTLLERKEMNYAVSVPTTTLSSNWSLRWRICLLVGSASSSRLRISRASLYS